MQNKIQLITYIDRLGCKNISELESLFSTELKELFGGVHILPFYYPIDGEDAGFDPIDHLSVDPRLGNWENLKSLSNQVNIMADLIVNHISAQSVPFKDYLKKGEQSEFASLFLSFDKVFPEGATEKELLQIYRPRPGLPFTTYLFKNDLKKLIWTTFTQNQIDIDVNSKKGQAYLEQILETFKAAGITMIRLDAAGYAIKKKGTSCFMIEETFDFIDHLTQIAHQKGIEVLVEIHSYYKTQIEIANKVDYVYDFALPVLVLDTIFNKNSNSLKNWLKISPRNTLTVLDTHDGIGIIDVAGENDKPGLIDDKTLDNIVAKIHTNSNNQSLKATGEAASNLDLYQVNCTYYNALGCDDNKYLISRAIQFFVPGIPQVYYMGFLTGENDLELLSKTRVGRDINRHYFTNKELKEHLKKPVVKNLSKLMTFRNNHPAFRGTFILKETPSDILNIRWEKGEEWTELHVNLGTMNMSVSCSPLNNQTELLFC